VTEVRDREEQDAASGSRLSLPAEAAAVVRAAFARGDRIPGLPAADGAKETADAVAADLAAGCRMWSARDADDRLLGCVRAIPLDPMTWQVRRLAVHPGERGRHVGERLMRALEASGRAEGVRRVVLDAVVERGNPPFYCSLGYRTVAHFRNPDKPLSEVAMAKNLAAPDTRLGYPWGGEPGPLWRGVVLAWFAVGSYMAATVGRAWPDPVAMVSSLTGLVGQAVGAHGPVRFLGADGHTGDQEGTGDRESTAELWQAVRDADVTVPAIALFLRPGTEVPAFVMPGAAEAALLALWRIPHRWQTFGH
jgi:GNAT superfamily N-acetyltransferase